MSDLLFISDLHLSEERPGTLALFERYCAETLQPRETLYILGDLFDAWIGDDDQSPLANRVREALRGLGQRGVSVYLMHGNRDFLLGEQFCNDTGAELLDDPTVLEFFGRQVVLMHGDLLCTDDIAYQTTRQRVRDPAFIAKFLSYSLPERATIAAEYRKQSGEATSLLADHIMDVNGDTVLNYMQDNDACLLIHGHTHRPADHPVALCNGQARRVVLGEWHEDHGMALRMNSKGVAREEIR